MMKQALVVIAMMIALNLASRVARRLMPTYGSDSIAKRMAFAVTVMTVFLTGVTGAMALSWLLPL
jgi:hypothetical protein